MFNFDFLVLSELSHYHLAYAYIQWKKYLSLHKQT